MRGRNLLEKTSRTMSSKFKIKLISSGSNAFTDGKIITIPAIPETLTQDQWEILCGYAEHEVAHIRFSDFDMLREVKSDDHKNMFNLLEDIRIERLHGNDFYGVMKLFDKTISHVYDKHFSEEKEMHPCNFLLFEARRQCNRLEIKEIPDFKRQCFDVFGDDIFKEVSDLKTARQCFDFALELLKRLDEYIEKHEKPEDPGASGDPDDAGDSDGSAVSIGSSTSKITKEYVDKSEDGSGESDEDSEGSSKTDEASDGVKDDSKDDSSKGKSKEDSDDKSDKSDETLAKDDVKPDAKETTDSGEGSKSKDKNDENIDDEGLKEVDEVSLTDLENPESGRSNILAKSIITSSEKALDADVGKLVAKMLSEISKDALDGDEYIVLTSENDIIRPVNVDYTDSMIRSADVAYNEMKEKIKNINSAKHKLSSMFLTRVLNRWRCDRERGRVNPRALAKLKCGYKNVFREKDEHDDLDTAITFLVDFSGSMNGRRIREALSSVILFLETLNLSKIKCEVLGYTTAKWPLKHKNLYKATPKTDLYGRLDPLLTLIIKDFNEPFDSKIKKRIGCALYESMAENCDGDSVMIAYNRLLARPEKRKILFVLSDGAVANTGNITRGMAYLKNVTSKIEKDRLVDLIGIGFHCDKVAEYYKDHILINSENNKNLAEVMYLELKRIFKV